VVFEMTREGDWPEHEEKFSRILSVHFKNLCECILKTANQRIRRRNHGDGKEADHNADDNHEQGFNNR